MSQENFMVYLPGSERRSFRCPNTDDHPRGSFCGANVFHKDERGRYVCNGCGAKYIAECSEQTRLGEEGATDK